MSLKRYLIIMSLMTLVCWLAWVVVLFQIDPEQAGGIGLTLFYVSLLFALIGTFSLLGFFIRVWFSKEPVIYRHLGISTRQSIWFAILVVVSLLLKKADFLRWWSAGLLLIFLLLLEFFYLSRRIVRPHTI
jgi:hypothetical protein